MKESIYILKDAVHSLQRERGCASIFLYSKGQLFTEKVESQFAESNDAIQTLLEELKSWQEKESYYFFKAQEITSIIDNCNELSNLRDQVLLKETPISNVIQYYSHQLIEPILQCIIKIALNLENRNIDSVSAYNAFLHWKESTGLERAIGARGFVEYSFCNKEFVERIIFLLSEQDSYQNTCSVLANEEQGQIIEDALESCLACIELDKLHNALKETPDYNAELYDITPEQWYDLITSKIDSLYDVEEDLINTLDSSSLKSDEGTSPVVELNSRKNSLFAEHNNLINSLQLFSGISQPNLDALLRHGQIRELQKGNLMFFEGEQANRLYIVLKGWVKIFKSTVNGEESVLQMLSSGDSILESAVFLNTPFPMSAQVAEDATLLSIPAPVIREQIKSNSELATNLLSSMSRRSQGLINQIENARLKSADERIGWFLLKLLLQQNALDLQSIKLPYDKNLIASYLDMKRETFSRSLKRLKGRGIKIEKNTILVPELESLCGFCDLETEGLCSKSGSPSCPKAEAG